MQRTRRVHWFEALADHMGPAYLRYSFTKGTEQEVDALVDLLAIEPGDRVLDVGCGPGRHSLELAARGVEVVGVDVADRFVAIATEAAAEAKLPATFRQADARTLDVGDDRFDEVISLCQGAFGLSGGPGSDERMPGRELDEPILAAMAAALRPGGTLAVSAFSAYFQLRFPGGSEGRDDPDDGFDAADGVNHEHTEVRNDAGDAQPAELWTTCYTPRELRLLARIVGLEPLAVHGVTPGDYGPWPPSVDRPEFLLVARRPATGR